MRIIYSPALSDRGSDYFLVFDGVNVADGRCGRPISVTRVDPDGSVYATVLAPAERGSWLRALLAEVRWGRSWWLDEGFGGKPERKEV